MPVFWIGPSRLRGCFLVSEAASPIFGRQRQPLVVRERDRAVATVCPTRTSADVGSPVLVE
jgi:hypothetical protein